jgi:hypothetical protein
MLSDTDDEPLDASSNLASAYSDDLTQDLGPQIIHFRSSFKTKPILIFFTGFTALLI